MSVMKVESRAMALGEIRGLVAERRRLNRATRPARHGGERLSAADRAALTPRFAEVREAIGRWLAEHGPAYRDADAGEVYVLDNPGVRTWSPYPTRPDAPCAMDDETSYRAALATARRTLLSHGLDPADYGVA